MIMTDTINHDLGALLNLIEIFHKGALEVYLNSFHITPFLAVSELDVHNHPYQ